MRAASAEPRLQPVLAAITRTTTAADRTAELDRALRKEARGLGARSAKEGGLGRDEGGGEAGAGGATREAFWNKRPKASLDLDSLAFEAGAHLMANADVKLPKRSEVVQKKGYQEVHVPALKHPAKEASEPDVAVEDMPDWARPAFEVRRASERASE